jgi:hypothetical protein
MPEFSNTFDPLGGASSLRSNSVKREVFDPSNPQHELSLKQFLNTGKWGDFQFYAEQPYTEVPMTVLVKYAKFILKHAA